MYSTRTTNPQGISEIEHIAEINHFQTKFIREKVFATTPAERYELKKRIQRYPNRNHRP